MKVFIVVLMLAILPPTVGAETYVCVEEHATGFRFNRAQQTWEASSFRPVEMYLVQPNADRPSLKGKWIVRQFGESFPFAFCEEDFTSAGALHCDGIGGNFNMNRKNLRFLTIYLLGYWTDAIPGEPEGFAEGKNEPHMAIGECSRLP